MVNEECRAMVPKLSGENEAIICRNGRRICLNLAENQQIRGKNVSHDAGRKS